MTQTALLELKGICRRFPGVIALDDVDLDVYPGEIVALIGENGAGKSTLMKIIGGVIQPDAGTMRFAGREVIVRSPREAGLQGIEFIHQELSVLDNLDVAANIFLMREPTYGGPLKLIDRQRIYVEADKYLLKVGLEISSRTPLSLLSIAQRQLVEIARALSAGARLLIMDEPTSSLTLSETKLLLQIVRDLKGDGVSIIYITHRLDEVQEVADRVVCLRDGRNSGSLMKNEIRHDLMFSMMVGRDLSDFYIHPENSSKACADSGGFSVVNLRTPKYPQQAVSINVKNGEVLGLAGLIGAGRTEAACAIFGIDGRPDGEIRLNGDVLDIRSAADAIEQGIYLIPEDRRGAGLIVDFSIRENISLPGLKRFSNYGLVNSTIERRTADIMCRQINIKTPNSEVIAANLSGGNQQKVVLAKWLALSPKVLIFDEPTRGIDVGAKTEIYSLIRNLAADGVAILVISSDMEELLGISDHIAVMHEGRITGQLNREEFSEEAIIRLATGG